MGIKPKVKLRSGVFATRKYWAIYGNDVLEKIAVVNSEEEALALAVKLTLSEDVDPFSELAIIDLETNKYEMYNLDKIFEKEAQMNNTSDNRTINNTLSHQYRILTDEEKVFISQVKDAGLAFLHLIQHSDKRELIIASERIEEAVMWAVKGITK